MKITTVRYRRLQSHDHGYGHDAVEAEAQVEPHETADEAMGALQAWVGSRLGMTRQMDDLSERLIELAREVRDLERKRNVVTADREQAEKILKKYDRLSELAIEHKLDIPKHELELLGNMGVPF